MSTNPFRHLTNTVGAADAMFDVGRKALAVSIDELRARLQSLATNHNPKAPIDRLVNLALTRLFEAEAVIQSIHRHPATRATGMWSSECEVPLNRIALALARVLANALDDGSALAEMESVEHTLRPGG